MIGTEGKVMTTTTTVNYVFELSFTKQKTLAEILDTDDSWEDLAGLMNLTTDEVMACRNARNRSNGSAASELLRILSSLGYPVEYLFKLLFKMHHQKAMKVLSDVVDQKCLKLMESLKLESEEMSLGVEMKLDESHQNQQNTVSPTEEQSRKVGGSATGCPSNNNYRTWTSNGETMSESSKEPFINRAYHF